MSKKLKSKSPLDAATCSPSSFDEARLTDATVNKGMKYGATKEEIITQLVREKNALMKQLVSLEMIAPKRYRKPDGSEWVYHCPNHLIPLENVKRTCADE